MTDCKQWFRELVHPQEIILDEDVAALQKQPEHTRIERYNALKANEEEFMWEFTQECLDFLVSTERDQVRSQFRLARLLIAASFYAEDELPRALAGDFIENELQAVVDFDRYKRFDVLSEEQIEEKIRRMDGEVYELVTGYTSTQIANMDAVMDNPDVQQDVMQQLLDRYEERREKIRQGFFVYVETHGLEHMVERIENAVKAAADASETRKTVRANAQEALQPLPDVDPADLQAQQRELEVALWEVEQQLHSDSLGIEDLDSALEPLQTQGRELSDHQTSLLGKIEDKIDTLSTLEPDLDEKIRELENAREETRTAEREIVREEAATILDDELSTLHDEKERLEAEIEGLRHERERIEAAHDRLTDHQEELASRVDQIEESVQIDERGLEGENVVTASMARLYEMDYIGRFDTSLADAKTIQLPERTFEVPEGYWTDRSEHRSARSRLARFLDRDDDPETYPQNQAARYTVTDSGFLGLSEQTELVIEAQVLNHLEAYAKNGFDARPADIDDLLSVVNTTVVEAEDGDYFYLLGVGSPTGWTDRVIAQLQNEDMSRVRVGRHVSVCLIDLQAGALIYDEADDLVRDNREIFELSIDAERIEECTEIIQTDYVDDVVTNSVLLEEVVNHHGFDDHVIKRAFNRLDSAGIGEQLYLDEYGLSLELDESIE